MYLLQIMHYHFCYYTNQHQFNPIQKASAKSRGFKKINYSDYSLILAALTFTLGPIVVVKTTDFK